MTASLHIRLSEPGELSAALDQLRTFAEARGVPLKIQRELHLAVDEIVTNIFRHGYGQAAAGAVDLLVTIAEGRVDMDIRDRAPAFNPLRRETPDITLPPEQREIGGLGIYFVRRLMDEVEYAREGGENRIRLRRQIRE